MKTSNNSFTVCAIIVLSLLVVLGIKAAFPDPTLTTYVGNFYGGNGGLTNAAGQTVAQAITGATNSPAFVANATFATTAGGAPPTGSAGGILGGTYPNPGFGTFSSATLAAALTDENGTGPALFSTGDGGGLTKLNLLSLTNVPASTLIGNATGGSAAATAIQLGANMSFVAGALTSSGGGTGMNTNSGTGFGNGFTNPTVYLSQTNFYATASTIPVFDPNKSLISLANGGANTFLQGTTPPTYTGITAASLPALQTAYPQAFTNNDNRTGGAVFNEQQVGGTNASSGWFITANGVNLILSAYATNASGVMVTQQIVFSSTAATTIIYGSSAQTNGLSIGSQMDFTNAAGGLTEKASNTLTNTGLISSGTGLVVSGSGASTIWGDSNNTNGVTISIGGLVSSNAAGMVTQTGAGNLGASGTVSGTNGFASYYNNKASLLSSNVATGTWSFTNTDTVEWMCFIGAKGACAVQGISVNDSQVFVGNATNILSTLILQPAEWLRITNTTAPGFNFKRL